MNSAVAAYDAQQLPRTTSALNEVMFAHIAEFVTLAAAVNRMTSLNTNSQIECTPLTNEEVAADLLATDTRALLTMKHEHTELQLALRSDSRPSSDYHLRIHAVREGACTKPFSGIEDALGNAYGAQAAQMILWTANDLSKDAGFQQQVQTIVSQAAMGNGPVKIITAGYDAEQNTPILGQ